MMFRAEAYRLIEFERGGAIRLRESGFSFRDIAERLGRNLPTEHDCTQQWLRDCTTSKRPGLGCHNTLLRGKMDVFGVRLLCIALPLVQKFELQFVPQWHNKLLEIGYFKDSSKPGTLYCIFHRLQANAVGEARAHWTMEWRSVVLSEESWFFLGTSDGRVLVGRRPVERFHPNCLRPGHTGPTPGVIVWIETFYDSRNTLEVFPNTLTANLYGVFQQDNTLPYPTVVMQLAVQSVDRLSWPSRPPDLSPIEHV
ncbi:transposable element Tc1 transposase [Trichonephila clavipes]|nr:transposable element Tc1 transposase [Trichonephila clavipes]